MVYTDAVLVTLRESLEAFLIIGVFAGLATKLGAPRTRRHLYAGAFVALVVSVLAAVGIDRLAREIYESTGSAEVFEGVASLLAVAILTYMIAWMYQHTQRLTEVLRGDVTRAVRAGRPLVLFSIAFVAVLREGLETALFLGALAPDRAPGALALSAVAGFAASAIAAYMLFTGIVSLSIRQFFAVSGGLLVLFAGGLLATGVHELAEAGLLPTTGAAWSTAALLPQDSTAGFLAKAVFGYRDTPSMLEAGAWLLYVGAVGAWFTDGLRPVQNGAEASAAGE